MSDFDIAQAPVYGNGPFFIQHLTRFTGETVTIFTTSGGESGSGFTGVLTLVTPDYVRIVTAIGSPPTCSLGNDCDCFDGGHALFGRGFRRGRSRRGFDRGFSRGFGLGSVVDIPVSRIASFVHNTL